MSNPKNKKPRSIYSKVMYIMFYMAVSLFIIGILLKIIL